MCKVSIIIPVFNSSDYLAETINSVIAQTCKDWEIILINDCSLDNSEEIIESYTSKFTNIKSYSNKINLGAGPSRNVGIKHAKGEYLAFLDADDVWAEDKLEKQIEFMNQHGFSISFTSYGFIDSKSNSIKGKVIASKSIGLKKYMKTTEIGLSTSIINLNKCPSIMFSNSRLRQDTKLWMTLFADGYVAHGLEEELVKYRIRSGQISGNKFKAILYTLYIYWDFEGLPKYKSLFYFMFYLYNAILKRLK